MLKLQPSDTAICSCILRSMPPTPQTANGSVVISSHVSWWALKPHCESSRTLLGLPLPCEFLVAISFFSPSQVSADLHCSSRRIAQGTASSAMLEGRNEVGIVPMGWDPWETKGVILLNSGSMAKAEQQSWIVLENTDFSYFLYSFPLHPSLSFFSCFHAFTPGWESERQSHELAQALLRP